MYAKTRWSQPWASRSAEEARLFNPAFCSELMGNTVCEYHRTVHARHRPEQRALSLVTAFIVLPLILHRPTREVLPRRANTVFAGWVANHGPLLVELPERALRMRPVSREALMFGVQHQLLSLEANGLVPGLKPVRRTARFAVSTEEVIAVRRAAALIGRWFARQGSQIAVLRGMGVAP